LYFYKFYIFKSIFINNLIFYFILYLPILITPSSEPAVAFSFVFKKKVNSKGALTSGLVKLGCILIGLWTAWALNWRLDPKVLLTGIVTVLSSIFLFSSVFSVLN
jgi:hypothetical protein